MQALGKRPFKPHSQPLLTKVNDLADWWAVGLQLEIKFTKLLPTKTDEKAIIYYPLAPCLSVCDGPRTKGKYRAAIQKVFYR